jgi:hypothetical protein
VRQNLLGRAGRLVSAEATDDHQLQKLTVRWTTSDDSDEFQRLVVERDANGKFTASIETAELTVGRAWRAAPSAVRCLPPPMPRSFPTAWPCRWPTSVRQHRLPPFAAQGRPFLRGLRKPGSRRRAPARRPRAERRVHNNGKTHQAMWFQPEGASRGSYYDLDGRSLRQAYLTSPVEFSRVQRLCHAPAPHPEDLAATWAPTLRPHRHQGAHRGRRRGGIRRRAERLRQRGVRQARQPTMSPSTPT